MDQIGELEQLQARVQELEAQHALLIWQATRQRDRFVALTQTATAFLVTHDLQAMASLVIRHATTLLNGVSHALIWLLDERNERLVLQLTNGDPAPYLHVWPGIGIAGRTAIAPRPLRFTGADFLAALAEHDAGDRAHLRELIGSDWPPHSAFGAPLRTEHEVFGALVLFGTSTGDSLLAGDLLFVQMLGNLLASALASGRQQARVSSLDQALHVEQERHAAAQQQLDAVQAGMLQTAKLAAVGQLAASVAHEINNPLYAVRSSLYLVEQDLPPDAPQHEFLALAQQELGRIARIIARMRDFYKPIQSEYQPTDLLDLIRETINLAATYLDHSAITTTAQLDPTLPPVVANGDQLRQVLLNLVLNACDAMSDGGTLTISAARDGDMVQLEVRDTGIGIPADVQARLFEPFFTTKPSGTGLGLSVSYHIVAQHGGTLTIESVVGQGTRCIVRLPVRYEPRPNADLAEFAAPRLGS